MKTLIVLPTYNEGGNITRVLSELNRTYPNVDILHIDDNSPDGTAELANELGIENYRQIRNFRKNGLGSAYKQGFKYAIERNYDFVISMDSDGSHQIKSVGDLIEKAKNYDLVIGSRWITGGSVVNWPWYRKAISKFGTKYAKKSLKLPFNDLTSGFKIYNVNLLKKINFDEVESKGYVFQIQMVDSMFRMGAKITEIPITFVEREVGKSKMTTGIALEAFKWCTKERFKRKN